MKLSFLLVSIAAAIQVTRAVIPGPDPLNPESMTRHENDGIELVIRQDRGVTQIKNLMQDIAFSDEQRILEKINNAIPAELPPITLGGALLDLENPKLMSLKEPEIFDLELKQNVINVRIHNMPFAVHFDGLLYPGWRRLGQQVELVVSSSELSVQVSIVPRITQDDGGNLDISVSEPRVTFNDHLDLRFSNNRLVAPILNQITAWFNPWLRSRIASLIQEKLAAIARKISHEAVHSQTKSFLQVMDEMLSIYEVRSSMADSFRFQKSRLNIEDGSIQLGGSIQISQLPQYVLSHHQWSRIFKDAMPAKWNHGFNDDPIDPLEDAHFVAAPGTLKGLAKQVAKDAVHCVGEKCSRVVDRMNGAISVSDTASSTSSDSTSSSRRERLKQLAAQRVGQFNNRFGISERLDRLSHRLNPGQQ